ncbi:MAG: NAD(P)-dependent oxidoreductase [Desulfobacteraceae bacterium]|nr:NAD(P)-dependent oxidoreductase [Desulfobacteraceae bacterium]
MKPTILITGSSGYLGSVLCADLCRDHKVVGLFRRPPSGKLKRAAPTVQWEQGDIVDRNCIDLAFEHSASTGRHIDYVIHFAAYTDFGEKWHDEYFDTNIIGTRNIIEASCEAGVKRILFAGSIAALKPCSKAEVLTEQSPAFGSIAYPKSKAMGEKLLMEHSDRVPVVVLRIGGVFTDWCELPPLYSVMKLWSKPVIGRMIPGEGNSGFPYIHRQDIVRIVRRIVEKNTSLDRFETLLASHSGCTYHKELFPIIRSQYSKLYSTKPLSIPLPLAKMALNAKYIANTLRKKKTYERAWMINYVDLPLRVDTRYTQNKLDWQPTPGLHILTRLPILMQKFKNHYKAWDNRNINRNDQNYDYDSD